jgi:hypothetical protein
MHIDELKERLTGAIKNIDHDGQKTRIKELKESNEPAGSSGNCGTVSIALNLLKNSTFGKMDFIGFLPAAKYLVNGK